MTQRRRIVLAYSGSLDGLIAIPWLAERHRAEIITVTLDLGQSHDLEEVRDRALAIGALRAHVLDVRDEFASEYILPSLKAGVRADGGGPMAASLSRPLIARKLVEIAEIEQASSVAHGGRTGSDSPCFDNAARAFNRPVEVLAPACEWGLKPSDKIQYARDHGVVIPTQGDVSLGTDGNLWGRFAEREPNGPDASSYVLTRDAAECPDDPALVDVAFHRGMPTSVNGVAMPFVDLIGSLTIIAGAHGVGRIAPAESAEWTEAPAAVVLHAACDELQRLVLPPDVERFSRLVAAQYAEIVRSGAWFGPLRDALDVFVDKVHERATGSIRLRLLKGECRVVDSNAEPVTAADSGRPLTWSDVIMPTES